MKKPKHSTGPTPINRAWSAVPTPTGELPEPQAPSIHGLRFGLERDAAYVASLIWEGLPGLADVHIAQSNYRHRLEMLHRLEAEQAAS